MSKRWIALGVAPLAALAITAGPAMAGGAISKPKAPTAAQKKAIMKAAKLKGPANCYDVSLSSRKPTMAGVKFKAKAPSSCTTYAFDGAALYYGNYKKTSWFLLEAGSSETPVHCDALSNLVGTAAWQDLIPYVSGMGCQNFD